MNTQFRPRIVEPTRISEPEEIALSRTSVSERVEHALCQRTEKEQMAMVPSLAKQMAKDSLQAKLDIFRLEQAERVGSEVLVSAIRAIRRNNEIAQGLVDACPELEADIYQMTQEANDVVKQLPRVGIVGYMRRNYPMDTR